jgi:flagellar P-ring protein precursor FlgI
MAAAINTALADRLAFAVNASAVEVAIPQRYAGRLVDLITLIEGLDVAPDMEAKVVINERTGTVVMGENVRISTVAVAHGNLSIEIKESSKVSQPMPFSQGQTVATPDTQISVKEESRKLLLVDPGVSIGEVVGALNALGVTPRDLIAIFQAIKAAGALNAKLEIL